MDELLNAVRLLFLIVFFLQLYLTTSNLGRLETKSFLDETKKSIQLFHIRILSNLFKSIYYFSMSKMHTIKSTCRHNRSLHILKLPQYLSKPSRFSILFNSVKTCSKVAINLFSKSLWLTK